MKYYSLLVLTAMALLLAACSSDPVDTTGSLSGTISDALSHAPLQGAAVTLSPSGRTTVTGADGQYQFSDVEQGSYDVSVSKADYVTDSKPATVVAGQNTPLDFVLRHAESALAVSPLTLDFGENDTQLSLNIRNNGQATMTWQITENTSWISCTPTTGSVLAGQTGAVAVTVDRTGLAKGTYTNTLVVTSNDGGSQTVRFNVTVGGGGGGLPQVSIISVDGVTDNAATFTGTLPSIGSSRVTAHGFCWSTQANTSLQQGQHIDLGQTEDPKELFSYGASGLSPNTTYYVRAFATNAEGTVYSSREERFTTTATPQRPQVETGAASLVTSTTATVAGNILALGHQTGITAYGHCWSSEVNMPTTDYHLTELGTTKQTGSFSSRLTNLQPGTTYYVRAYARNQYGTNYGQTVQFTTAVGAVTLNTHSASNIIHNEATCGGHITSLQGNTIAERGVCWSTASNPTRADSHKASADNTDNFTVRLTGLKEKTDYHARAYAVAATGETYYGQDVQFTTTHEISLPQVSATTATGVTSRAATFAAQVTSLGNGHLKRSGFCYATTHNPTVDNNQLSCGTATTLRASTSALTAQTTYYVRAYAENEKGLSYGPELTITTRDSNSSDTERDEWPADDNWN